MSRSTRRRTCPWSPPPQPIPWAIPPRSRPCDGPPFNRPRRPFGWFPGQPLVFSSAAGDGIALRDPDAGPLDPAWDLTLSVAAGTLTLAGTAGLVGSGDGTGTLRYRGPLSALNAALEGLSFTPPPGFLGNTTVSLDAKSAGAMPLQTQFLITDGRFLVTTTADSGPGSLRQAILDSNVATGGSNTIDFAIPGQGVQTIDLVSPLPAITNPVLIDGSSQPGYTGTPLIAIDTSSSGMADGLTITGSDVTVRGLVNGGFALGAGNLSDDLTLQSGPLQASDSGNAGRVDTYRIDTSGDGRLLVQLHVAGPHDSTVPPRLSRPGARRERRPRHSPIRMARSTSTCRREPTSSRL